MTAMIVPFSSCGAPRQFGVPLGTDQLRLPCGDVVEVVGLNQSARDDVNSLEDFSARHLSVDRPLDPAHETLVDADAARDPRLGPSLLPSPVRDLHNGTAYDTAAYFVNGHGEIVGAQYATVAYVYIMHPGNRLRQLRKDAGLTQAELAERTGFTQDRISNYENGRRPMRLAEMRVLSRGLGCSVADILEDGDNPDRLTAEERELLAAFRYLNHDERSFLLTSAGAVASRSKKRVAA